MLAFWRVLTGRGEQNIGDDGDVAVYLDVCDDFKGVHIGKNLSSTLFHISYTSIKINVPKN